MHKINQMVKVLRYEGCKKDWFGKALKVVGELGLVVHINDDGTNRILLQKSKVLVDGVFPEDCEPV